MRIHKKSLTTTKVNSYTFSYPYCIVKPPSSIHTPQGKKIIKNKKKKKKLRKNSQTFKPQLQNFHNIVLEKWKKIWINGRMKPNLGTAGQHLLELEKRPFLLELHIFMKLGDEILRSIIHSSKMRR
jgi:hypothetical protein